MLLLASRSLSTFGCRQKYRPRVHSPGGDSPAGTVLHGCPLAHGPSPRHREDFDAFIVVARPTNAMGDYRIGWLPDEEGGPLVAASIAPSKFRKTCFIALKVGEPADFLPPHMHDLEEDVYLLRQGLIDHLPHIYSQRTLRVPYLQKPVHERSRCACCARCFGP